MSSESSKNEQIEDDSLQSDYDNNDFEGLSSVKLFLDELNEKNYDFAQIDNRNFLLKDSVSKNLGKNNEIWEQDQEEWTKTLNKNQNSLINICKKTKDLEKYLEESPQKTKDVLYYI